MATIYEVLENIKLLQYELLKMKPIIQDEIISVMIDGSVVRGDFVDNSSDIDITITTLDSDIDLYIKNQIEETIKNVQNNLPKREYPRKPLIYDIQWHNINIVKKTGKRKISGWNLMNIPKGYPKLWLYAFDNIKYHNVIFGEDITKLYTRIPPEYFVPMRLERIIKSVEDIKGNITAYEIEKGAITQVKNAWEAIRCICISKGLVNINKNDVYAFAANFFDAKEWSVVEDLKEFYLNNNDSKLTVGDFRNRLYNFTLSIIKKYHC